MSACSGPVRFLGGCGGFGWLVVVVVAAACSDGSPASDVASVDGSVSTASSAPGAASESEPEPAPEVSAGASELLSASEIYARVSPSVAFIETAAQRHGSGILVDGGYVVTNYHIVWPHREARVVFPDGAEFSTPVVGWDPFADLAVLGPIDASVSPLRLADGEAMTPGSDVYLVGYPSERNLYPEPSITAGILSRFREWDVYGITMLQTDADIAGGQSGGALVNGFGEVVGISTWSFSRAGFSVATSAADDALIVQSLIEDYETYGGFEPLPVAEAGDFEYRVDLEHIWDRQAFAFDGEEGLVLSVEIDGPHDGEIVVGGPAGEVASVDETYAGVESAVVELPVDGPTFVAVSTEPADTDLRAPSSYVLSSSVRLAPFEDPDDGTRLAPGDVIGGVINYHADVDWYPLNLTAGDTILVWTDAIATDTLVYIDSPTGEFDPLALDDDSGPALFGHSTNAELVYTAPVTGEYFVVVSDPSGAAGGDYFLGVDYLSGSDTATTVPTHREVRFVVTGTTTWQELFGEIAPAEQQCIADALGDDLLADVAARPIMDDSAAVHWLLDIFRCLNTETAEEVALSVMVARMRSDGVPLDTNNVACLREALAATDVMGLIAEDDNQILNEFQMRAAACLSESAPRTQGLAPVDEVSFARRVVGGRLNAGNNTGDGDFFVDFMSNGRFVESGQIPGSYRYSSEGPNSGTLTLTFDGGDYGGSCTISLMFDSVTTGALRYTCGSGIQDQRNWQIELIDQEAAFLDSDYATRSIPENIPAGINVDTPVSAVGAGPLTYTMSGLDAESFVIVADTGQIRTREGIVYDHETENRYTVTVDVVDSRGGSDTIDVAILVEDLLPACGPPRNLRTSSGDQRLTVRWGLPRETAGQAQVLGYEVEIRRGDDGPWTDRRTFLGPNISATTYDGLANEIAYQIRIRPINTEADCQWSPPFWGIPTADLAPKDPVELFDRLGTQPIGVPSRNFRFLTPERCRHTSGGVTLDANCRYHNTGPDTGRISLEFDDPSRGSCAITLAYSTLTAGSFGDECFDAGVNTNVPFDRSFRMPNSVPQFEDEADVPRAPRTAEEFDVLVWGRGDFIPGLWFGCAPVFDTCEFAPGHGLRVERDPATGIPTYTTGEYSYENTGPSRGVLTFRTDDGNNYVFTLDFEPSGNVRATIGSLDGAAPVWPGMPHATLGLEAQPILLPIPPSWSAAIAIETDVAPEDWDGLESRIPTPSSPVHPISPRDNLLGRTLLGRIPGLADAAFGGGEDGDEGTSEQGGVGHGFGYNKLGHNRAIVTFDFWNYSEMFPESYFRLDELQRNLSGSLWVFDLTFTSDGAAKYTLTITQEGHVPTVLEGTADFTGDGIILDEFPEEVVLPDDPPQAPGVDLSGVEVAAGVTTSRIGGSDVQTLLIRDQGLKPASYRAGDWLEPKDGSNQRMMIMGAGQAVEVSYEAPSPVEYLTVASESGLAGAPTVAAPMVLRDQMETGPLGFVPSTLDTNWNPYAINANLSQSSQAPILQLFVVCMQSGADIPKRGARYFSEPKAAEGRIQTCQRNCVLSETASIQECVWKCEENAAGN